MAKWVLLVTVLILIGMMAIANQAAGQAAASTMHCVAQLDPVQPGQTASKMVKQECYTSFEEAMQASSLNPDDYQMEGQLGAQVPQPTPAADIGIKADPTQHCVALLDPIELGKEASKVQDVGCFATFPEAISAATANAVQLAPDVSPATITPAMLDAAQTTVVIGIDYINATFGGTSYTWSTAHTPGCSDGSTYGWTGMPTGWNDVVSSARSYSGCNHFYHFQDTWWGGPSMDCGGSCSSMGVMDNQTSSERLTP